MQELAKFFFLLLGDALPQALIVISPLLSPLERMSKEIDSFIKFLPSRVDCSKGTIPHIAGITSLSHTIGFNAYMIR